MLMPEDSGFGIDRILEGPLAEQAVLAEDVVVIPTDHDAN